MKRADGWTDERPTKAGRYEVYLAQSQRSRLYPGYSVIELGDRDLQGLERDVLYGGALWREYVEPADPHAVTGAETETDLAAAVRRLETELDAATTQLAKKFRMLEETRKLAQENAEHALEIARERDAARKQAAEWEVQAQDFRDRLVKAEAENERLRQHTVCAICKVDKPTPWCGEEGYICVKCLVDRAVAAEKRLANLRAKVEGLPTYADYGDGMEPYSDAPWLDRSEVIALVSP